MKFDFQQWYLYFVKLANKDWYYHLFLERKSLWGGSFQSPIHYFIVHLTRCPCKIQSLNQIPFFNFIKSICYISWSRCLKFIDVWLAPFDPHVGVQISPKCQKRENNLSLYWNHFNWKSLRLLCCLKSQMKFFLEFPYSWENWEFFANLVFWKF